MTNDLEIRQLKLKLDIDYLARKSNYDLEAELLKFKRDKFYAENPDFPIKTMYMQVVAPPQRISINIIE